MVKKFRFKTRTRSIGGEFRIYGNDGTETGTKDYLESEFKTVADTAEWYEGEPCVAMYENDDGIYVAAFGLDRGEKDFSNRPKGFHFYALFDDKYSAWSAFTRMIFEWSEAEAVMRSSIREEKSTKGNRREDVYFDEKKFTDWLQGKREIVRFAPVNPNDTRRISLLKSGSAFMPKKNCVLKWEKGGYEIYCFRAGKDKLASNNEVDFDGKGFRRGGVGIEDDEQRTKKSSGRSGGNFGKIIVACLIVLVIVLGSLSYLLNEQLKSTKQELYDVRNQLTAKENELTDARKEIDSKDIRISELEKTISSQNQRILELQKKTEQENPQQEETPTGGENNSNDSNINEG